jgi:hypothetical protein
MKQSRRYSMAETLFSTAAGFFVSLLLTAVVLPWLGHDITAGQNVMLTTIFTVASVVRGYVVRRLFEAWR